MESSNVGVHGDHDALRRVIDDMKHEMVEQFADNIHMNRKIYQRLDELTVQNEMLKSKQQGSEERMQEMKNENDALKKHVNDLETTLLSYQITSDKVLENLKVQFDDAMAQHTEFKSHRNTSVDNVVDLLEMKEKHYEFKSDYVNLRTQVNEHNIT